jgi:acyl-CoA hydrolase
MRQLSESELAAALGGLEEPRVVVPGNHATPQALLSLVDAALPRYRLLTLNAAEGMPDREGVVHETPFVGAGVRHSPRLVYLPARLSLVPRMFRTTLPPDVVLLHTTPPRQGVVSLGVEVNILPAAIEAARSRGGVVIAQVNEQMPWTTGDALVRTEQIDYALSTSEPLPTHAPGRTSDLARAIAEHVAPLVPDGATLQAGIGAIPDAVLSELKTRSGLRVYTEMFSDGVLDLERAGALDRDHPLVASFVFGSAELLAWVHDNPRVRMLRTERTNDPAQIARQPKMTSLNTALQVDLFGQANASWINHRIYSGLGGQSDFVVGALHSRGGQAVMALSAWHPKAQQSTVVSRLDGPATSFQHSWIVSEYGRAAVWSQPLEEQARQLIEQVAHPDARAQLRDDAVELGVAHRA